MIYSLQKQRPGARKRVRLADGTYSYTHIYSRRQKTEKGYGISGDGSKWLLSYILVEHLLQGLPTLFQVDATTLFLFDGNGVRLVDQTVADEVMDNFNI
jgi:hypothetical protein